MKDKDPRPTQEIQANYHHIVCNLVSPQLEDFLITGYLRSKLEVCLTLVKLLAC